MIKALMLNLLLVVNNHTVDALLMRSMFAGLFCFLDLIFCHSKTIHTSSLWPVRAMPFLHFLFTQWFVLVLRRTRMRIRSFGCRSVYQFFSWSARRCHPLDFLHHFWLSATYGGSRELSVLVCNVYHISIPMAG